MNYINKKDAIFKNLKRSANIILDNILLIFGIILLVSLIYSYIPPKIYAQILNCKIGVFLASIIGGISAGNPMICYLISGELIKEGISLVVINAFILSWITVGVVQIPIEAKNFGIKFTIIRQVINLILSIIGAYLIYYLVMII